MSNDNKRKQNAYHAGAMDAIDDLREWLIPLIADKNAKEQINAKLNEIAAKF